MDDLPARVGRLETRVDSLDNAVGTLREDVSEIRAILPALSTKADVAAVAERLSSKIDASVVGLLRDALSAYPARIGNLFALMSAVAAIATVGLTFYELHH